MVKLPIHARWIWRDRGAKKILREHWPLYSKFAREKSLIISFSDELSSHSTVAIIPFVSLSHVIIIAFNRTVLFS